MYAIIFGTRELAYWLPLGRERVSIASAIFSNSEITITMKRSVVMADENQNNDASIVPPQFSEQKPKNSELQPIKMRLRLIGLADFTVLGLSRV